ncbi:hypothetical protein ACFL0Q_05410 [Thermodesulfobacteriota bacterium]
MPYWTYRKDLSKQNKLRRSIYEILRDELDQYVTEYAMVASYTRFKQANRGYPFVEMRELKPRARISPIEHEWQNTFLILFVEDTVPSIHKKHICFLEHNRTTKRNIYRSKIIPYSTRFDRNLKHLETPRFLDFLKDLLPVDYALLIQRDPATKARNRYSLTHFHVRIDWPVANAAEDLARSLRYISKDLFEKGENYAEDLQKKFFQYYGMPDMCGGRRTAAIVAAQFLGRLNCISTIYVGSSEARACIRICETGASNSVLVTLPPKEMAQIAEANQMNLAIFTKNYIIGKERKNGIAIFRTTYDHTSPARPPEDGRMRDLKPDLNWLSVDSQHIMPKPASWRFPPLPHNRIYS